jgi:uncharacterized protein YjbJ (UPF0337 family)
MLTLAENAYPKHRCTAVSNDEAAFLNPTRAVQQARFNYKYFRSDIMNWDQIAGKWKQVKGQAQEKWGKMTDDHLNMIDGQREQLVGTIQEIYGVAQEDAEEQVKEFETCCKCK